MLQSTSKRASLSYCLPASTTISGCNTFWVEWSLLLGLTTYVDSMAFDEPGQLLACMAKMIALRTTPDLVQDWDKMRVKYKSWEQFNIQNTKGIFGLRVLKKNSNLMYFAFHTVCSFIFSLATWASFFSVITSLQACVHSLPTWAFILQ